jgi:hypothetical protein
MVAAAADGIGERQEWPITVPFLDRRSKRGRLGREMLAIAWFTALGGDGDSQGKLHALCCIFLAPWGLQ